MTKLEEIMDLLRDRELTSLEIASEINIPKDNCSSYLNTLYNDRRIERISDKRPFKYKRAMTREEILELMKFSNDLFKENLDYLLKDPKISEYILKHEEFDKIEVLVK